MTDADVRHEGPQSNTILRRASVHPAEGPFMSDEPVIRQEHLRRGAVAACVVSLLLAARCAGEYRQARRRGRSVFDGHRPFDADADPNQCA